MTNLLFAGTAVLLWIAILGAWTLLMPSQSDEQESDFDMTIEMSKSGGYSVLLVTTGFIAVATAFGIFAIAEWL